MTKQELTKILLENYDDGEPTLPPIEVNEDEWTFADLFIRRYLNDGNANGFGMTNVGEIYHFIVEHKQDFIKYNMISKEAVNNYGIPLWKHYEF